MPVLAAVIGNMVVAALAAGSHMPAKRLDPAGSMADITFSWVRLTCPALARRHAGPYRRKMSAISSLDRVTPGDGHSRLRFTV